MKTKSYLTLLLALFTFLLSAEKLPAVSAQRDSARSPGWLLPVAGASSGEGTGITYQGWLSEAGRPADGAYDFEFKLFDAGGDPAGPLVTVENLEVRGGVFTALLDFGSRVFTGERRTLQVGVRPGASTGAYTALTPGQEITAAPSALSLPGLYTLPDPASPSLIGGFAGNLVPAGTLGAAIGGGGDAENPNRVTDHFGSVGGGAGNQAGDDLPNPTTAAYASVSGGLANRATASFAAIGGGEGNTVSAAYGAIPGGAGNRVNAEYGVAAGRDAWVQPGHSGAILFADSNPEDIYFPSQAQNEFAVRATGGVRLVTGISESGVQTTGCSLPNGSATWACTSDRNAKMDYAAVDGKKVLERLAAVPVTTWSFKAQETGVRHMGPVAQDFYAAFQLGEGETTISSVDANGVALAAIQGLRLLVNEQAAEIVALEQRLAEVEGQQQGPSDAGRVWAKAILLLGLLLAATSALCACTLLEIRKLKAQLPRPGDQSGRRPQA